jgi:hypothetical protein
LEADVNGKVWLGGAVALVLAAGACLVTPRFGGFALIFLGLAAVAVVAYRLL